MAAHPDAPALDDGVRCLTYTQLLAEVDRVRDRLVAAGVVAGCRVGVRIPSGTADLYLAILAVLAAGAAYVPVDVDDPEDRAELVWSQAGVGTVLTEGLQVRHRPTGLAVAPAVPAGQAGPVPAGQVRRPSVDDDAWIIFTSGTTGIPKGVAVTHRSAAAFVDAEAGLFCQDRPLGPGDRVLAGLSVAFDASCEEMWLAWRHGGCLLPAPRALLKTGPEFASWLVERAVTVISTVPTLAALWPLEDLARVRLVVLGGEACPAALVDRLATGQREVWNTYGPTETTVVACAARLVAGEPIRIGVPLAGWRLAVVDPTTGQPVRWGQTGELAIAGVGVSRYLDPERDAQQFPPLPATGWARAYRSGDLVRAESCGLVFVGRVDTQVKIRGYRIELGEIEAALERLPGVAQAVVTTCQPRPGLVELAGYFCLTPDAAGVTRQQIRDKLRGQLPAHMVPTYLCQLAAIPTTRSGKADRTQLPDPAGGDQPDCDPDDESGFAPAAGPVERLLAEEVTRLLNVPRVSVTSHLFRDLGLNSLLIAHLCARLRQLPDAPVVTTKDIYLHPTVRELAAAVTVADKRHVAGSVAGPAAEPPSVAVRAEGMGRSLRYVCCGVAQLLAFLGLVWVGTHVSYTGFSWIEDADGLQAIYLRSVVVGGGLFAAACLLPIALKWLLVGRFRPGRFRLWGLTYFRFWLVKTLIRANPLVLFVGSAIYPWYLRLLGARIGRQVAIFSKNVPICPDLLTVGDDTVIRKDSWFQCYQAEAGEIRIGPVTIGREAFVGERTVLSVDSSIGDRGQLGHSSCLYPGAAVPAGEHWHGSPAQPTDQDYLRVSRRRAGGRRAAAIHAITQLAVLVLITLPASVGLGGVALDQFPDLDSDLPSGLAALGSWACYQEAALTSTFLVFGGLVAGLAVVTTVPRLLQLLVRPGRTYPLYGMRYSMFQLLRRLTNIKFFLVLFGDSSYAAHYLRAIGYRMPDFEQTGSNFGAALEHDSPLLTSVGRGTMISDGVSFANIDYSSTSFRLADVTIGPRNFFGNMITFPAGGRIGENCLVATKAMVPLDGPVREGVGLLGSPCFEIPRTVERDRRLDHLKQGDELRWRLAAKNHHNLATIAQFLLVRWFSLFVVTALGVTVSTLPATEIGTALAGLTVAGLVFNLGLFIVVERAVQGFRSMRPRQCSIYELPFWRHERYWKLMMPPMGMLNGTPFKTLLWRLLGVRIGRRVYDDGCGISERTLTTIGDDCTLNSGSLIQCHSMEDGTFKSDHSVIGAASTLGVGAFVHYGVTIGAHTTIAADSFLMKGEAVPPTSHWGGNPAQDLRHRPPAPTAPRPDPITPRIPRQRHRRAVTAASTQPARLPLAPVHRMGQWAFWQRS